MAETATVHKQTEPDEWISMNEAGRIIGMSPATVALEGHRGRLIIEARGRYVFVLRESAEKLRDVLAAEKAGRAENVGDGNEAAR